MRRILALCCCLCLVSCGPDKYGGHPPFPTTGVVLVNGQPAADALVVFHHLEDWGTRSIVPQAWTDSDGRFVLSTYAMEDGAPAGDYRVVVEWPAYHSGRNIGPDRLGGKFATPKTSTLQAHVDKGTNELPPFDLKATLVKVDQPVAGKRRGKQGGDR